MNYLTFNDQECEENLNGIDIAYSGGGYESGGESSVGGLSLGGMSDVYSDCGTVNERVSIGGMSSVASDYADDYCEQDGGRGYYYNTDFTQMIRDVISINIVANNIFGVDFKEEQYFSVIVNPGKEEKGVRNIQQFIFLICSHQ